MSDWTPAGNGTVTMTGQTWTLAAAVVELEADAGMVVEYADQVLEPLLTRARTTSLRHPDRIAPGSDVARQVGELARRLQTETAAVGKALVELDRDDRPASGNAAGRLAQVLGLAAVYTEDLSRLVDSSDR